MMTPIITCKDRKSLSNIEQVMHRIDKYVFGHNYSDYRPLSCIGNSIMIRLGELNLCTTNYYVTMGPEFLRTDNLTEALSYAINCINEDMQINIYEIDKLLEIFKKGKQWAKD